jgi:anti-sigma factor RsiW
MNGEHPSQELLQRYLDGELSNADHVALSAHMAGCAGCARQHASLQRLGQWVTRSIGDEAAAVDLSRMFQNIEAGIAAERTAVDVRANGSDGQPQVVPLRKTRARRFSSAAPALGALALAAAVMLMVYRPDSGPGDSEEGFDEAGGVSEVTDIDFGANAGTVFDISLSDGSSTPVVWIDDDDDEE